MKRTLALAAAVAGITITLGTPAASAGPKPDADCVGQNTSGLAQAGKQFGADFRGLGGLNEVLGTAGGDVNAVIRTLCSSQPPVPG